MSTLLKPDVPDTVIRFLGQPTPRIAPSAADTVAVLIVHDWGPVAADSPGATGLEGGLQDVGSFDEFVQIYGDSDTAGRTAVAGAFAGQGLPGAPGAGGVVVCRMAGSSAAKAAFTINDRVGPAAALRLTARYSGTRGNKLSVIVDADPSNVSNDRLRILYNGAAIETYTYAQTDVAGLTATINLRSTVVTATNLEGAPLRLAAVAGSALVGGDDGNTLVSNDHLAALAAIEHKSYLFSAVAVYDLTDSSLLASYVSWVQLQDQSSRPVRFVSGGAAGESITTAITRATACADPHVLTVGVGTYHDDLLNKDLSTSQLAPRVAGILVAKGEEHAITAAEIAGLHAIGSTGPDPNAVSSAVKNGVVVLMPADSPDADVRIAKGVTTFTAANDPNRPLDVFSDARLVGLMDAFVRAMRQWGNKIAIGSLPVNDDTRRLVQGQARKLEDDLLRRGLILPGDDVTIPKPWVQVENTDNTPALRDTIPFTFGWQFARTTNAILGQGRVI